MVVRREPFQDSDGIAIGIKRHPFLGLANQDRLQEFQSSFPSDCQ